MVQGQVLDSMDKAHEELIVARRRGASLIDRRPVFSPDSNTLFVVCGSTIRSYNVDTGQPIRDYEGLNDAAAGVFLRPDNEDVLVSLSREGQLVEWEWRASSSPSRELKLQKPRASKVIVCAVVPSVRFDDYTVVAAIQQEEKKAYKDANVNLFSAMTGEYDAECRSFMVSDHYHSLACRHHNRETLIAGIVSDRLEYFIQRDGRTIQKGFKDRPLATVFSCIAAHPTKPSVIVGGMNGFVFLWQNLLNSNPALKFQWHRMPVRDLLFSSTGTSFYSAGDEAVVVRWLVDTPGERTYIPRFGAEIVYMNLSSAKLISVSTRENAIEVCSPDSFRRCVIQHFSWMTGVSQRCMLPAGLKFDPRSCSLVLNARVGHIQFLNLPHMTTLSVLDVTGRNYLTQTRASEGGRMKNTEVRNVEFSSDGTWMATVEHWRGEVNTQPEWRLKFWEYSRKEERLLLNTSIEYPHRDRINALQFQPSVGSGNELCITCGQDKKFRTWILVAKPGFQGLETVWRSENVGFHRDLPAGPLDFSCDGSLVAVAFGPTLTIWVPKTNDLKCSLTQPDVKPCKLSHVHFGRESCSHLVTVGSKRGVAVWNILSLSLTLVVPFPLTILVADPLSSVMAAFTDRNDVVVFSPNSSDIIHKQFSLIPEGDEIIAAAFIPHCGPPPEPLVSWQTRSQLYFINTKEELLCLVPKTVRKKGKDLDVLPEDALAREPSTVFKALQAQQIQSDVQVLHGVKHTKLGIPGFQTLRDMLASPAHTMPPPSLLCRSLLMSFVSSGISHPQPPQVKKPVPKKEEKMDDDSGAESGNDVEVPHGSQETSVVPKENSMDISM